MSGLLRAAPLWRRLCALVYDTLLLLALWMSVTLILLLILRVGLGHELKPILMQPLVFLIGWGFFSWFWTRGGQTLGMRAWRLQLRRIDGLPLQIPAAGLRYIVGLVPLIVGLWAYRHLGAPALSVAAVIYLPCLFDSRGRALNDWVAGTEMVELPKAED